MGALLARTPGAMPPEEAERRLLEAAMEAGLGRREALSTIRRPMRWGMGRVG